MLTINLKKGDRPQFDYVYENTLCRYNVGIM